MLIPLRNRLALRLRQGFVRLLWLRESELRARSGAVLGRGEHAEPAIAQDARGELWDGEGFVASRRFVAFEEPDSPHCHAHVLGQIHPVGHGRQIDRDDSPCGGVATRVWSEERSAAE